MERCVLKFYNFQIANFLVFLMIKSEAAHNINNIINIKKKPSYHVDGIIIDGEFRNSEKYLISRDVQRF